MKKTKIFLLLFIFIGLLYSNVIYEASEQSDYLKQYNSLLNAEGVNIIDGINNIEIDGDLAFSMRLFNKTQNYDGTKYEGFGDFEKYTMLPTNNIGTNSEVFTFKHSSVKSGVDIYNVGFYQGVSIDARLVMDEINLTNPDSFVRFFAIDPKDRNLNTMSPAKSTTDNWEESFLQIGSGNNAHSSMNYTNASGGQTANITKKASPFMFGDNFKYHYEFFESDTRNPINITGIWHYGNLNYLKVLTTNGYSDLTNIYVPDTSTVLYRKVNNSFDFYNEGNSSIEKSLTLSQLYAGSKLDLGVESRKYSGGAPDAKANRLGILYSQDSVVRISPASPIVWGQKNKSGYFKENTKELNDTYKDLNYQILVNTAKNTYEDRNDELSITTEVPEYYDLSQNVVIKNLITDKTFDPNAYTVNYKDSNKSQIVIKFKDAKSEDVNNSQLLISVTGKTNNKFSFSKDRYGYLNDNTSEDNGYMHFDLAESTYITYSHKASNKIDSKKYSKKIDDKSIAKVRYDGVPDGDVKKNLTYLKGTDFTDSSLSIDVQTEFLDNLRVDTDNEIDLPVIVSYKTRPDSSTLGKQKIILLLTSAKGVVTEKEVEIEILDIPKLLTTTVVNGVDMDTLEPSGSYKQVQKFGEIQRNVTHYGDKIDISQDTIVTNGKKSMSSKGWDFQGTIQQIVDGSTTDISDTNVTTSENGTIVNYLFKAQKGTVITKFENSKGEKIADSVSQIVRIPDGNINLLDNKKITDTLGILESDNYSYITRPADETNVTPKANETVTVTYVLQQVTSSIKGDSFEIDLDDIQEKTTAEKRELILKNSHPSASKTVDGDTTILTNFVQVTDFGGLDSTDLEAGKAYTVTLTVKATDSGLGKDISTTIKVTITGGSIIVDPDDGETPFIPTDPDTDQPSETNPSKDLLKIQYASSFDFGTTKRNFFSNQDLLSAGDFGIPDKGSSKKVPAFISILDQRKDSTGWDLSVSSNDFISQTDNKTVLKGAYMTLSDGKYNGNSIDKPTVENKVEIGNTASPVSSSKAGLNGSWSLALGDLEKGKSTGVNLTVPKNSAQNLGDYRTNIVWTLAPKIK